MISSMLDSLEAFLKSNVGLNVLWGQATPSPNEYPVLILNTAETGDVRRMSDVAHEISLPIDISVIIAKSNYKQAFDYIEKVIKSIRLFEADSGSEHSLSRGIQTTETDNSYKVGVQIALRFLVRK